MEVSAMLWSREDSPRQVAFCFTRGPHTAKQQSPSRWRCHISLIRKPVSGNGRHFPCFTGAARPKLPTCVPLSLRQLPFFLQKLDIMVLRRNRYTTAIMN